jgi:hypothetical protein
LTDENGVGVSMNLIDNKGGVITKTNESRDVYMMDKSKMSWVGRLGGKIDGSVFIPNLLTINKARALFMDEKQWLAHVFPDMEWDYKNNSNTIFGVAWAYDKKKAVGGDNTEFTSNERDYDDAAQFGNFNAGYTGTYAGIPAYRQYMYAGLGEIAKARSKEDMVNRYVQIVLGIPPYGDEENDYEWNTRGMRAARQNQ